MLSYVQSKPPWHNLEPSPRVPALDTREERDQHLPLHLIWSCREQWDHSSYSFSPNWTSPKSSLLLTGYYSQPFHRLCCPLWICSRNFTSWNCGAQNCNKAQGEAKVNEKLISYAINIWTHLCKQVGFGAHTCNISKAWYILVRKTDQQLKSEHNDMKKNPEIAKKRCS